MMQDRLINPLEGASDAPDANIRPALLAEYIGQPVVREQMEVFIGAARGRDEALDHTLIFGPPGLGKRRLPILSLVKWVAICVRLQALSLSDQVIWQRC